MRILYAIFSICFSLIFINASATHNLAGEITYTHNGNLVVEININTFTRLSAAPANRDSLIVCFGDGDCQWALRVNGPDDDNNGIPDGEVVGPNHKLSVYAAAHTYPSNGQYAISMTDPNRNGGITNIFNSSTIPFHIETTLNLDGAVPDSSPVMLEFPIDKGIVGEPFTHIPNAFDTDGDSIVFSQIIPLEDVGSPVPLYFFPEEIQPGPENMTFLDTEIGQFTWIVPQNIGAYTIAILVQSYRNGVLMSSIIRDMQIDIFEEDMFPPDCIINTPGIDENIPMVVNVGDTVRLDISAMEVAGQQVELTSSSGLYSFFNQNAEFDVTTSANLATGQFEWIVEQEHVRDQPYMIVFKAKNNDLSSELAAFRKVRYLVSDQTTGLNPVPAEQIDVSVFPNPAPMGSDLHLKWAGGFESLSFTISDPLGRVVMQGDLEHAEMPLPTNRLLPGLYYLKLRKEGLAFKVLPFIIE